MALPPPHNRDYLLGQGIPVAHIMGPGKFGRAALKPDAQRLADETIRYARSRTGADPSAGSATAR
ncbi:MAG TPA: hypothetical protein VKF83_13445 [Stellaceae bacterium]|nr:hypothetical protein [Stellaceae bacterium]